ncbi:hypothetical protein V8E52_006335 [Russula decolorans]
MRSANRHVGATGTALALALALLHTTWSSEDCYQGQCPQTKYLTERSKGASITLPLNGPKHNQLDMPILPTSEKVMEADTLLKKAGLKLEEFRGTLGQESYEMAQGWLEISKGFKAGLEDKNVLGSYKQAQEYLGKAKETYEAIMQLTMGLYYQ